MKLSSFWALFYGGPIPRYEHNNPCHDEDYASADCRAEIRFDLCDSELAQDCSEACKHSGKRRIQKPPLAGFPNTAFLFLNHQVGSGRDGGNAYGLLPGNFFVQQENASRMVSTVEDLSTGTTLFTSPS